MQDFLDVDHQGVTSALNQLLAAAQNAMETRTTLDGAVAKTLTVAQFLGGEINRTGITSATIADVTPTAAQIVAAMPRAAAGDAFRVAITNNDNTAAAFSLSGGTGVTLAYLSTAGVAAIPPNTRREYVGVLTAVAAGSEAVTLTAVMQTPLLLVPTAKYSTAALEATLMTGAQVAGANHVFFDNTGTTPGNLQFPTAANLVAAIPNALPGYSYVLKVRNSSGSANTATLTTNTGLTLTGTMTIAQNVTREFVVTLTSLTAVVIQSVGVSAAAA